MKENNQLKKTITIILCCLTIFCLKAQVTLSTDFTNTEDQKTPLHDIWGVANRISPKTGSNVRSDLKMNIVRMIGGINKRGKGKRQMDLEFDTCLYDSINNVYVYQWKPLIKRLNKIINSQTEIFQIVLDQPPWAFQHGYTFIPKGTKDGVNFSEDERMTVYGNALPPADKQAYHDYIKALMTKLVETYGKEKVRSWRFRVGSEIETPEHWRGTKKEFIAHFANTEKAIRAIVPDAKIGLHTRAPNFLYKKGSVLNYKGKPFASFAKDFITYCYDNNVRYDFWGVSDYVIIGNKKHRDMEGKFEELFGGLVNHPKWNAETKIDLMEYATVTKMVGPNGYVNCSTSHREIVELEFSNQFYANKDKGLSRIYRWGNRKGSEDRPAIKTLKTMVGKTHYKTTSSGSPAESKNTLKAIFAKKQNASNYDVLVYNYNANSLAYKEKEAVRISFTTKLPVGSLLYYRSMAYGEAHNGLQNFLKDHGASLKKESDNKGDAKHILNKAGQAAYKLYENPNPHKFGVWKKVRTIAPTNGGTGSVIQVETEIPSFAFEKLEFRSKSARRKE